MVDRARSLLDSCNTLSLPPWLHLLSAQPPTWVPSHFVARCFSKRNKPAWSESNVHRCKLYNDSVNNKNGRLHVHALRSSSAVFLVEAESVACEVSAEVVTVAHLDGREGDRRVAAVAPFSNCRRLRTMSQ
jgi:hypothetical protein